MGCQTRVLQVYANAGQGMPVMLNLQTVVFLEVVSVGLARNVRDNFGVKVTPVQVTIFHFIDISKKLLTLNLIRCI